MQTPVSIVKTMGMFYLYDEYGDTYCIGLAGECYDGATRLLGHDHIHIAILNDNTGVKFNRNILILSIYIYIN